MAQEHHRSGVLYYASLETPSKKTQKTAAEQYKLSAELYLNSLTLCESHLLSLERDKEMQQELKRIQTMKHSVEIVLKYL
jgi:hypothetical protein